MNEAERVLVAGLLHDIGQFWQRTGERHGPSYDRLSESDYGPRGEHAKWSADVVERFLPEDWRPAAAVVLSHHRPTDRATKLVAVADWLSSGERDDEANEAEARPAQLRSLFSRITLEGAERSQPGYYGLRPLGVSGDAIFPSPAELDDPQGRAAYQQHWSGFTAELA